MSLSFTFGRSRSKPSLTLLFFVYLPSNQIGSRSSSEIGTTSPVKRSRKLLSTLKPKVSVELFFEVKNLPLFLFFFFDTPRPFPDRFCPFFLLSEPESAANSAISRMKRKLARTDVDQEEMEVEYCDKGGLLTSDLVEQANEVIDLLNDNRELVWNWRGK